MVEIRKFLAQVADGHAAIHGASAPNLFADVLAEIARLDEIERLANGAFRDSPYGHRYAVELLAALGKGKP